MKKPKIMYNDYLTYIVFIVTMLLTILIFLVVKEWELALVFFSFIISATILLYSNKRLALMKLLINEKGLTKYCKKTVLKELKWGDIKDAVIVNGRQMVLSDTPIEYEPIYDLNNDKNFIINIYRLGKIQTYIFKELCRYNNKIPVKIRNIDKLPPEIAELLKQDRN